MVGDVKGILDIGTGTGVLSLILAQQFETDIDAVEIDAAAAQQAKENFAASPWHGRLQVFQTGVQEFNPEKKYGLIISNPPFFESDLRSANAAKNAAKHDTTLTLEELISIIKKNLSDSGAGAILIPFHRTVAVKKMIAEADLFITNETSVKQTPLHSYFRTMLLFSKTTREKKEEEIIIHDMERVYTERFVELLRPYYLKL